MLATRTLEFDRIVDAVTALALTPLGAAALAELEPSTDPKIVVSLQAATSETVRFLERHPLFPLRAGEGLPDALDALDVQGRPLEPLQLRLLADFVDSVDQSRARSCRAGADFPILRELVANVTAFKAEVDAVRQRDRSRRRGARSGQPRAEAHSQRAAPEAPEAARHARTIHARVFLQVPAGRGRHRAQRTIRADGARRASRQRAGHRARLLHDRGDAVLEPAATVEINNDIVELEDREREEIFRILLELTDRFRARPNDMAISRGVARELDVVQAKARYSSKLNAIEPEFTSTPACN